MSAEVEKFLSNYASDVEQVALSLREKVKGIAPDCVETLHAGWKVISYGYKNKFCAIAPHSKWVNLQFYQGTELDDPSGILAGTGKSMRHVKVQGADDITQSLEDMIKESANKGKG